MRSQVQGSKFKLVIAVPVAIETYVPFVNLTRYLKIELEKSTGSGESGTCERLRDVLLLLSPCFIHFII
jgi:hypothetical protein